MKDAGILAFLQQAPLAKHSRPVLENLGIADLLPEARDPEALTAGEAPSPASAPALPTVAPEPRPAVTVPEMVREAGSKATPKGEYRLPKAADLADTWQELRLRYGDNPRVMQRLKPQMEAVRSLALARHQQDFDGDPMSSPEEAARYARHWGALTGRFGEPMSAQDAAHWADYLDGAHSKRVTAAKTAMLQGDLPELNRHLSSLLGPGWQATGATASTYDVAGLAVPSKDIVVQGPNGERQVINTAAFELGQANLETRLRLAKATADAEQARADEPTRQLLRDNQRLEQEIKARGLQQQREALPASEVTRALAQENEALQARITHRGLQAQWDHPPSAADSGAPLSPAEKTFQEKVLPEMVKSMTLETPTDRVRFKQAVDTARSALGLPPLAGNAAFDALFGTGAGGDAAAGTSLSSGEVGPPAPPEIIQRDAERLQALPRSEREQVLLARQQATRVASREQAARQQRTQERLAILTTTRERIKASADQRRAVLAELDQLQGLTPEQERQVTWLVNYLLDPRARDNSSMTTPAPRAGAATTPLMPDQRM